MKTVASAWPVAVGLAAVALLSVMDALIKHVSGAHGTPQVVLLRYAFGALFATAVLLSSGVRPTRGTFRRAGKRVIFILVTVYLFFFTLTRLPLAEAVAITFTAPFFMLVASRILLHERMPPRGLIAVACGFVGVLVMAAGRLGDVGHGPLLGYAAGLACSVTYALSMVTMRRDTNHDPVPALVFAQNTLACAGAIPAGVVGWTMPELGTTATFALIGLFGTIGHLCMGWAYAHAPASRLGPLEYTAFIWAAFLGWAFFGESPTVWTVAGAALIVGSCLIVLKRSAAEVG